MKVKFWIKSSRGTNANEEVDLPDHFKEEDIKSELEDWCSNFGAWTASENHITYGYEFLDREE